MKRHFVPGEQIILSEQNSMSASYETLDNRETITVEREGGEDYYGEEGVRGYYYREEEGGKGILLWRGRGKGILLWRGRGKGIFLWRGRGKGVLLWRGIEVREYY